MNVYKIVQEKIIAKIQEAIENGGAAPWVKPWNALPPRNFITKKPYRGINYMLLDGGSYLTFRQIQELQKKNKEIKLKKGSKSHIVVFWKMNEKENEEGEKELIPILKYYRVFSIKDVEGLEEDQIEVLDHEPIEIAEELIENYSKEVPIRKKFGDRAYYNFATDQITLPLVKQFKEVESYYSTAFHEMIHSTGYKTRFARFNDMDSGIFGSESYSKEELIAEIGSCMLMNTLQIDNPITEQNSISYLYAWLQRIEEDVTLVVSAAQQAQKASDFILKFHEMFSTEDEIKLTESA